MTADQDVLALEPFVRVDPNPQAGVIGPNITFTGVNLHIVSGSNATDDNGARFGLGNLIIGYNEVPPSLGGTDRGGSHNLVIGRYNPFTPPAFAGIIAGDGNTISGPEASVTGGSSSTAGGQASAVLGTQTVNDNTNFAVAPVVAP